MDLQHSAVRLTDTASLVPRHPYSACFLFCMLVCLLVFCFWLLRLLRVDCFFGRGRSSCRWRFAAGDALLCSVISKACFSVHTQFTRQGTLVHSRLSSQNHCGLILTERGETGVRELKTQSRNDSSNFPPLSSLAKKMPHTSKADTEGEEHPVSHHNTSLSHSCHVKDHKAKADNKGKERLLSRFKTPCRTTNKGR